VTTRHDWDGGVPLYVTVVSTVAAVLGVRPDALVPLASVFDPDAFEEFVDSGRNNPLRIQFEYHDCTVTVDGTGTVTVIPPAEV
jgi:hypothetical protein